MRKPLLLFFVLVQVFSYSEFNLYADLNYGYSTLTLEQRVTVEVSEYFIPEFTQKVWVSPYFSVQSVGKDGVVNMDYEVYADTLAYTTRESVGYGEWYNTIIDLKPKGINPIIYGDKAYYFNPIIQFMDNYSVSVPDGWTYLYNISTDEDKGAEVFVYQLPRSYRFLIQNHTDYILNFSEYENTIVRISDNFWYGYKELSDIFNIPLQKTEINSKPPQNFNPNVLAHFKLDNKVIEYSIGLSAEDEKDATQTLLHEVVHALTDKKYPEGISCDWFSEGLPEYLSYSILNDSYNFTDDKKVMKDNLDACICLDLPREPQPPSLKIPEYACGNCDRQRLPYDKGYFVLENISKSCDLFPCLSEFLMGPTCLDVTNTLAACCGDVSFSLDRFDVGDYGVGQIQLHQIYELAQNCSDLALRSVEIQNILKPALKSFSIDAASSLPKKCSEFSEVYSLADTKDKKKYLENNIQRRGIKQLKTDLSIYDRVAEIKVQASNLRCLNKSVLNTSMINIYNTLNSTIDELESREFDFGSDFAKISTITDNSVLRERAKNAWQSCDFSGLVKVRGQVERCEKIKTWGPFFYLVNLIFRTCP